MERIYRMIVVIHAQKWVKTMWVFAWFDFLSNIKLLKLYEQGS